MAKVEVTGDANYNGVGIVNEQCKYRSTPFLIIMARIFCIPGVIFIFFAFVLNFLASISLPYLTALDITRTHFDHGVILSDTQNSGVTELKVSLTPHQPYRSERIFSLVFGGEHPCYIV